jgi:hypothetical protein
VVSGTSDGKIPLSFDYCIRADLEPTPQPEDRIESDKGILTNSSEGGDREEEPQSTEPNI